MRTHSMVTVCRSVLLAALVILTSRPAFAEAPAPKKYASPEDAVRALAAAGRQNDLAKLLEILGPGSEDLISSGDPVADQAGRRRVVTAAAQRTRFEILPSGAVIAHLGTDDWPLPIPLVKDGDGWRFDTAAGHDELINRRVGRNELKAIAVCLVYVEAQREYASHDRGGAGAGVYAQKVRSEPGKQDGLYWDDPTGKQPSPLGPLLAEAAAEGYGPKAPDAAPSPYHGYLFRILTAQGAKAPGGARTYVRDGRMTGGFGLVAYPADYGNSGVMTFVVGPEGLVYQKNLGDKTAEVAKAITTYDPDDSWVPTRDE